MNIDNANFPDRKSIKKSLLSQLQGLNVEEFDYSKVKDSDYCPISKVVDKQKSYFYIRIYLNDEDNDIKQNDDVVIGYTPYGEKLTTKFIAYGKKGNNRDSEDDLSNYEPEDNKKVLCLMIDTDVINYNSEDIKFIRSLFRQSRYFQYQMFRTDEFEVIHNERILDYHDIDFS